MSELFIYSTPPQAVVTMTLDNGGVIRGEACTAHERTDAHRLIIPPGTSSQGALLKVACDGQESFEGRGVLVTSASADAQFMLDDVHLVKVAPPPPPPPPPQVRPTPGPRSTNPTDIINGIFASGAHSLATKEGCGKFTEACCAALHEVDPNWGHIRKSGAQNQFNGHAVDAIQLRSGEGSGIYDIIVSSESPDAKPAFNRVGDPNLQLWFFPA